MGTTDYIDVDNFAGGGGASLGIRWATGKEVEIAINHDEVAIAMHKANHPFGRELINAILSLVNFELSEQVHFVSDFANAIMRHNRKPIHLIIDEADEFCPQRPSEKGELPKCMGRVKRIVTRGRQAGPDAGEPARAWCSSGLQHLRKDRSGLSHRCSPDICPFLKAKTP